MAQRIPGGAGRRKKLRDFDEDQVLRGIAVELEHVLDSEVEFDQVATAAEIALDHLSEDRRYYDKLARLRNPSRKQKRVEREMKDYLGKCAAIEALPRLTDEEKERACRAMYETLSSDTKKALARQRPDVSGLPYRRSHNPRGLVERLKF